MLLTEIVGCYMKEQRALTGIGYVKLTGDFNYGIAEENAGLPFHFVSLHNMHVQTCCDD